VGADQVAVEPLAEQRPQTPISGARLEGLEPAVGEARDAGLEVEAEQVHDRKHDVGDAAAIDVQALSLFVVMTGFVLLWVRIARDLRGLLARRRKD
jgi:hypothetical protein